MTQDPIASIAGKPRKADRFYGDPVKRFREMANSQETEPVDRAHFRMWCRIAADEIEYASEVRSYLERQSHGQE